MFMEKLGYICAVLAILICIGGCGQEQSLDSKSTQLNEGSVFRYLDAQTSGFEFTNTLTNTDAFNIFNYRNFYNGGGVGIGDINNDGLQDIYMTSNQGQNKLFLNKGELQFEDITTQAGVGTEDKWSTGVTFADINGDGLLDIYVCNAGYQKGVDQRNNLYINNGDLTFVDEATQYGLDENGYTTHTAFFDYDRDGDLDAYILNNSFIPVNTLNYSNKRDLRAEDWHVKDFLKGGGDKLLKNENGKFVDVSGQAGIYGSLIGFGLGVTVGDVNGDHYPDIYVSNDFFERDYLYINNQKGGFSEELQERISHLSHSSMGADMADINNDGAPEIFVTDMLPDDEYRLKTTSTFDNINLRKLKEKNGFYNQFMHNTLQLNDGEGNFSEVAFYSGVAASDWSWGALMFDADNDSHTDLLVCNGILNDVIDQDFIDFFANDIIQEMVLGGNKAAVDSIINKMPSVPISNKIYKGSEQLKFVENTLDWGLSRKTFSNGAAYGDLDNDGDLDLVINNVNQPADLVENISQNNYLKLKLEFEEPNMFAIGAKVKAYVEADVFYRELIPSRGFQSSVDYNIVIGLGERSKIDSLEIIWPNGQVAKYPSLAVNQSHQISYDASQSQPMASRNAKSKSLFNTVAHKLQTHKEDDYVDFYYERNIPMELSKEGPCAAVGDFNGDGIQDLYLGAAAGMIGQLYEGTASGYRPVQSQYFDKFKAFEDTCAEFFDCDGDGDLDLLVGSGGNNVTYAKRAFRDRLYVNRNGVFEINLNATPPVYLNTACVRPHDYDGDGDLDLFVGSRSVPGEYGLSPGSHIYNNNGKGQFLDVTQQLIPELSLAGMITDALWADVLPQRGKELILVGEWMAPKILSFDGVKFNIIESELSKYAGWWQTLATDDIDQDGDQDILLGNIGDNFYLKADTLNPLFLWINDFDNNGSVEKLITTRSNNRDIPVVVKRDIVDQLPGLKKENLMHSEYAKKALQDLFPKEKIESSVIKQINCLQSMIAVNDGAGNFTLQPLSMDLQLSCINAIAKIDVDRDGDQDLVLGGNNHFLLPQFSRLDACKGKLLMNENGDYTLVDNTQSGLRLNGVVRELKLVENNGRTNILALQNSRKPLLYKIN